MGREVTGSYGSGSGIIMLEKFARSRVNDLADLAAARVIQDSYFGALRRVGSIRFILDEDFASCFTQKSIISGSRFPIDLSAFRYPRSRSAADNEQTNNALAIETERERERGRGQHVTRRIA